MMATLVTVHSPEGQMGRCDAKCHDATDSDCTCICGGRNHGVGLRRATENTIALFEQWAEKAKAEGLRLCRGEDLGQLSLFEEGEQ